MILAKLKYLAHFCKMGTQNLSKRFDSPNQCQGTLSPCRSEHITVSWMRSLLVGDHFVLEADQNLLHGVIRIPVFEHVELCWFYNSVALVDTWQIDFRVELDCWRNLWVLISTLDFHHVDSVIKIGVLRTNDGAIPFCKGLIVT